MEGKSYTDPEVDIKLILNSVLAPIYWKNRDSVYIGCNPMFAQVSGLSSINDVIGKTDYQLPWGLERSDVAKKFINDDQYVMNTGNKVVVEDTLVVKNNVGLTTIVQTEKTPLLDKQGNIIGVLGIAVDITNNKESERLRVDGIIKEQEKFRKIVEQVNHDILSPLTSLQMLNEICKGLLPEKERSSYSKAITRIVDIANNMMTYFRPKNAIHDNLMLEEQQPLLVALDLLEILTEKRYEYSVKAVEFIDNFTQAGNFAFIKVEANAFKRMISNLINNAVEASQGIAGTVIISLDEYDDIVKITVQDNGNGMPPQVINKIMSGKAVTNKKDGHGIGMTQVMDTIAKNEGNLSIESEINVGTKVMLTFQKISPPEWITQKIELLDDDLIIILDDDESIHGAWDSRFEQILQRYPKLSIKHFRFGQDTISYINSLTDEIKAKVFLLTDYELLKQKLTGIDVIGTTNITRTILVTSYYTNQKVINQAKALKVKILPKQLAQHVSINIQ